MCPVYITQFLFISFKLINNEYNFILTIYENVNGETINIEYV